MARETLYPVVATSAESELRDGGFKQIFGRSVHFAELAQLLGFHVRVASGARALHACLCCARASCTHLRTVALLSPVRLLISFSLDNIDTSM